MRILARFILLAFCLFTLFTIHYSLFTKGVYAEGEFETDYNTIYTVTADGSTNVVQNITLKNKTSNYYADKFELKIGSTKVQNVAASDSTGPLETNLKFEDNLTTITVFFKQRVIGMDKTLPWKLEYSSGELATKAGQIWEVSIPRLGKSNEIVNYLATVKVPVSFGPVAIAIPEPKSQAKFPDRQEFTFDKEQLFASGISMSFGEKQVFSFNLDYFLENNNFTTQNSYIALPPDNNYQKIFLSKINPSPVDVIVDGDGNFLAKYKLSPRTKLDIRVEGYVEVFSKSARNIFKTLTENERQKYTQPQRYWEIDNAFIKDKAEELQTPKEIYEFVANLLIYDKKRLEEIEIERMGAVAALASPNKAVCMEYTDLFIAIARAAGIPTREVEGYAYTQNERLRPLSLTLREGDILHAWPEYWDEKLGWVQIDPTWGSTSGGLDYFNKLDFNHITFVQRGISSTSPSPAGGYKREENLGKKSVDVKFAQELPAYTQIPNLSISAPEKIISGIPVKIIASLENIGSSSIVNQKITLISNNLRSVDGNSIDLEILPPFAKRDFIFKLQSEGLFASLEDTLVLSFADTQIAKPLKILPIYKIFMSFGFILSLFVVITIFVVGRHLHNRFFKRKIKIPQKIV